NMARVGVDLKAVVSFHGLLKTQTPAQPGQVKARVLVETGADDPMAPPADEAALNQEMIAAGVDHEVHAYPGALHAFTNPAADSAGRMHNMPVAYNAAADKQSSQAIQDSFKRVFSH